MLLLRQATVGERPVRIRPFGGQFGDPKRGARDLQIVQGSNELVSRQANVVQKSPGSTVPDSSRDGAETSRCGRLGGDRRHDSRAAAQQQTLTVRGRAPLCARPRRADGSTGDGDLLDADERSNGNRFTTCRMCFQHELDDLCQIGSEFVERSGLSVSTWKAGNSADVETRLRVLFNIRGKRL